MRVYMTDHFGGAKRLDQLTEAELADILSWDAEEWDCSTVTPDAVREQIAIVREGRALGLLTR